MAANTWEEPLVKGAGPSLGYWGQLPVIAIGPRGGKIVGYGKMHVPIYAGSTNGKHLSQLRESADGVAKRKHPHLTVEQLKEWLDLLQLPSATELHVTAEGAVEPAVTVNLQAGLALVENFHIPIFYEGHSYIRFHLEDVLPHVGKPFTPQTEAAGAAYKAKAAAGEADVDPFPSLGSLKEIPAGKFAGSHGNKLFEGPGGRRFVFKHASEKSARAEEAANRLGRLLLGSGVIAAARHVTLNGKKGVLLEVLPGSVVSAESHSTFPVEVSQKFFDQVVQHQVVDWLISNHDSHGGNWVETPDGRLAGIDKGQAWKFIGEDKLDTEYQPNHSRQIYINFWKQVAKGQVTGDPVAAASKILDKIDTISDQQFLSIITPAAHEMEKPESTAAKMLARKHNMRHDWSKFLTERLGKPIDLETAGLAAAKKVLGKLAKVPQIKPAEPKPGPEKPKAEPAKAQTPGWPMTKGPVTIHHPGVPPAPGSKWPAGYPGPGFNADIQYKGKQYMVLFVKGAQGEFEARMQYPDKSTMKFASPNAAADSMVLYEHKLPLDTSASDKKHKHKISYPAAKAFGIHKFATELAAAHAADAQPFEEKHPEAKAAEAKEPGESNWEWFKAHKVAHTVLTSGTSDQRLTAIKALPIGSWLAVKTSTANRLGLWKKHSLDKWSHESGKELTDHEMHKAIGSFMGADEEVAVAHPTIPADELPTNLFDSAAKAKEPGESNPTIGAPPWWEAYEAFKPTTKELTGPTWGVLSSDVPTHEWAALMAWAAHGSRLEFDTINGYVSFAKVAGGWLPNTPAAKNYTSTIVPSKWLAELAQKGGKNSEKIGAVKFMIPPAEGEVTVAPAPEEVEPGKPNWVWFGTHKVVDATLTANGDMSYDTIQSFPVGTHMQIGDDAGVLVLMHKQAADAWWVSEIGKEAAVVSGVDAAAMIHDHQAGDPVWVAIPGSPSVAKQVGKPAPAKPSGVPSSPLSPNQVTSDVLGAVPVGTQMHVPGAGGFSTYEKDGVNNWTQIEAPTGYSPGAQFSSPHLAGAVWGEAVDAVSFTTPKSGKKPALTPKTTAELVQAAGFAGSMGAHQDHQGKLLPAGVTKETKLMFEGLGLAGDMVGQKWVRLIVVPGPKVSDPPKYLVSIDTEGEAGPWPEETEAYSGTFKSLTAAANWLGMLKAGYGSVKEYETAWDKKPQYDPAAVFGIDPEVYAQLVQNAEPAAPVASAKAVPGKPNWEWFEDWDTGEELKNASAPELLAKLKQLPHKAMVEMLGAGTAPHYHPFEVDAEKKPGEVLLLDMWTSPPLWMDLTTYVTAIKGTPASMMKGLSVSYENVNAAQQAEAKAAIQKVTASAPTAESVPFLPGAMAPALFEQAPIGTKWEWDKELSVGKGMQHVVLTKVDPDTYTVVAGDAKPSTVHNLEYEWVTTVLAGSENQQVTIGQGQAVSATPAGTEPLPAPQPVKAQKPKKPKAQPVKSVYGNVQVAEPSVLATVKPAIMKMIEEGKQNWAAKAIAKSPKWPVWCPPPTMIVEGSHEGVKYWLIASGAGHDQKTGEPFPHSTFLIISADGKTSHGGLGKDTLANLKAAGAGAGLPADVKKLKKIFNLDKAVFLPGETVESLKAGTGPGVATAESVAPAAEQTPEEQQEPVKGVLSFAQYMAAKHPLVTVVPEGNDTTLLINLGDWKAAPEAGMADPITYLGKIAHDELHVPFGESGTTHTPIAVGISFLTDKMGKTEFAAETTAHEWASTAPVVPGEDNWETMPEGTPKTIDSGAGWKNVAAALSKLPDGTHLYVPHTDAVYQVTKAGVTHVVTNKFWTQHEWAVQFVGQAAIKDLSVVPPGVPIAEVKALKPKIPGPHLHVSKPPPMSAEMKAKVEQAKKVAEWAKQYPHVEAPAWTHALSFVQQAMGGAPMYARMTTDGQAVILGGKDKPAEFAAQLSAKLGATPVLVETPLGSFIQVSLQQLHQAFPGSTTAKGPDGKDYPTGTQFTVNKVPVPVATLVAGEVYKISDHKSKGETHQYLKVTGAGAAALAKLKGVVEKYQLAADGEPKVTDKYTGVGVTKSSLAAVHHTDDQIVPEIPVGPPAFVAAAFPAVGAAQPHRQAAPVNRGDLSILDSLILQSTGRCIWCGKHGVFEDNQVRAYKVKAADGKLYYQISGRLQDTSLVGQMELPSTHISFLKRKDFDPKTGLRTEATNGKDVYYGSFDGRGATLDSGTIVEVVDEEDKIDLHGAFRIRIPVGQDVEHELAAAFQRMALNPATALAEPTEEDRRLFLKANVLRSFMGPAGHHIGKTQWKNEQWLDEQLTQRGAAQYVVTAEITHDVMGKAIVLIHDEAVVAKSNAAFVYSGHSSVESMAGMLLRAEGMTAHQQRWQSGIVGSETSVGGDTSAGGSNVSFTRFGNRKVSMNSWGLKCGGVKGIYHPRVLNRADWYAHAGDSYGSSKNHEHPRQDQFNNSQSDNEICFRSGVANEDLAGVTVESENGKKALIAALNKAGRTEYNGIPLAQFILVYDGGSRKYIEDHLPGLQPGVLA